MESIPANVTDKNVARAFEHIFSNAFGNPIILNAIPTAAQMKANTWGIYGSNLYVKFANNVLLRFAGTVIT